MKTDPSRNTEIALLARPEAPAVPVFTLDLRHTIQRIILFPGLAACVAILARRGDFFRVENPSLFLAVAVGMLLFAGAVEVRSAFKQVKAPKPDAKGAGAWDYAVIASTLAATLATLAAFWFVVPFAQGPVLVWPFVGVIVLALPAAVTYLVDLTIGFVRFVREFAARFQK